MPNKKVDKKILFVASEAAPFIRTGGLGDVAGALPRELAKEGNDVRVVIPLYKGIPYELRTSMRYEGNTYVNLSWRYVYAGVYSSIVDGITYYFIDNEYYFKRDGLYGYFDDGERFAFFSRAVIEMLSVINFKPDIIHTNDWQSALVSVYLDAIYKKDSFYQDIKTVFTIHNIQFQGKYGKEILSDVIGLPHDKYSLIEYDDCVNFMKGAIETANKVTTVSPNYAKEIFDPYFSYGLDRILSERYYKISGIVNGIDQELFNPRTDKNIIKNYSENDVEINKKINRDNFIENLNLAKCTNDTMVIGMVTRLTEQKGIDLVTYALETLLQKDVRIIILGQGDWIYEKSLLSIQERYKDKMRVIINFSTELANRIYASSDIFLMPSKFEPCGLSQLISKSYGTVPVVREIGGLKDTVIAYNQESKKGSGFTFYDYNAHELINAVERAENLFKNKKDWYQLVKNIMKEDLSWKISAKEYIKLYNNI